jgi:type I restriction-modification system DNA methylase subunit
MARGRPRKTTNGANLGSEAQLFLAADKLRKNLEPSDYKHVALGLIFLKHISIAFEAKRAKLLAEVQDNRLAASLLRFGQQDRVSHGFDRRS